MVFDAVTRHKGTVLSLQSFREATGASSSPIDAEPIEPSIDATFPDKLPTLSQAEDDLITEALRRADGNQGVAAGLLGISRQALNKRLTRRARIVAHGAGLATTAADRS
jgi:two-component system, NtrC family, nitrogen regulation response regulator GlnG